MPIKQKKKPTPKICQKIQREIFEQRKGDLIHVFKYAGEEGVTYARRNGSYIDRSANLRSSVGYVLAERGKVVSQSDFSQLEPKEPKSTNEYVGGDVGKKKALSMVKENSDADLYLVMVAGMNYAFWVEHYYHREVLSGASNHVGKIISKLLKGLK
ncbi:MAG: hypothetical protein MJZ98_00675 [Paludibacteraceae bacterium]|nr:hypothetical protein [Paludibacteraceae bacterium]